MLTPFVQNIVSLFLVIRPVASFTQDSAYQLTAILILALLDSTSSNCVGGQPIANALDSDY